MIIVGITTYPRYPERVTYLEQALAEARRYLSASRHEMLMICSCETEPQGDVQAVRDLCGQFGVAFYGNDGSPSMGANQNNVMQIAVHDLAADYVLIHVDDCYAVEPIDLSDDVDFLDQHPEIDILRYHWSGRPGACPTFHERPDGYMQVDPTSKWFYDDSPHIRRANHTDKFDWQLTLPPASAGAIERNTNDRLRARGANIIATPRLRFSKGGVVSACH